MEQFALKILLEKMTQESAQVLESAVGFAAARGHAEVGVEHLLIKLLESGAETDLGRVCSLHEIDVDSLWQDLIDSINLMKVGEKHKPGFSLSLFNVLERAYLISCLYYDTSVIDEFCILEAVVEISATLPNCTAYRSLMNLDLVRLRREVGKRVAASFSIESSSASSHDSDSALSKYTIDLTKKAEESDLDFVSGRHNEIRMMIDILSRRRKNNPILVGEPGVGKTAIVEGLAQKIVQGDVPDLLKGLRICVLDLGLLKAGASMKGEFEKRLKSVISEVESSNESVMLFIDEAHSLIGAGGEAGTSDAANLLKPALARGTLRTIAATTWSEYKQYFERDPALVRRFQMVKVDEPSIETAIHMLSGIKEKYEAHHCVHITDEALEAAVRLSNKYINGRYLPDKAIDLLDTAAARVNMSHTLPPQSLEDLQARIKYLQSRLKSIVDEESRGILVKENIVDTLRVELEKVIFEAAEAEKVWRIQFDLVKKIQSDSVQLDTASPETLDDLLALSQYRREALASLQQVQSYVHVEVNALSIANVVADWTGIPVGSMVKHELHALLTLEANIMEDIIGQDDAIRTIAYSLRTSKAGLKNPETPLGVFLLAGPSGVGKTETARSLARHLFGCDKALLTINMSEYQEAHSVSQLKGSPPGYVGYGQGGILSEAVRRRPYSVVLLDEVEKAHVDVMNLFYQVFDRGFMRDGEGREIDFKNTVILMTSNLGSEEIKEYFSSLDSDRLNDQEVRLGSMDELLDVVKPEILSHFAPALVARMQVVPFKYLSLDSLERIIALKLDVLAGRLKDQYGIDFACDHSAMEYLSACSKTTDSGARYINSLLEQKIMPSIANKIIGFMIDEDLPGCMTLLVDDQGSLCCDFYDKPRTESSVDVLN